MSQMTNYLRLSTNKSIEINNRFIQLNTAGVSNITALLLILYKQKGFAPGNGYRTERLPTLLLLLLLFFFFFFFFLKLQVVVIRYF